MAEIGAAFLCVKAGVSAEPREDHAHYLKSWIAVLKADEDYATNPRQQKEIIRKTSIYSSNEELATDLRIQ